MARKRKRKASPSKAKKLILIAGLACVLTVLALGGSYVAAGAPSDGMIYVRKGITNEALRDSLVKHSGDSFASRVMTLLSLMNSDMSKRQGAFRIEKGESAWRVARHLRGGMPSSIRLTFNNVRTKEDFINLVGARFMADKEDFAKVLNSKAICAKYDKTPENITCIIMPDSYEFMWDITPEQMLERFDKFYNKFWSDERKARAKALGLTPVEVSIIASITEEETAKSDERGKVGRLYINRYKSGMKLQADPTVKFAIGDFSIRRLSHAMLQIASPYNTYRVAGLPPGPIRFPEKNTIDAILGSEPHPYIYMCAKSDFSGYHDFTITYEEHLKNAHRYQEELNKRKIK